MLCDWISIDFIYRSLVRDCRRQHAQKGFPLDSSDWVPNKCEAAVPQLLQHKFCIKPVFEQLKRNWKTSSSIIIMSKSWKFLINELTLYERELKRYSFIFSWMKWMIFLEHQDEQCLKQFSDEELLKQYSWSCSYIKVELLGFLMHRQPIFHFSLPEYHASCNDFKPF